MSDTAPTLADIERIATHTASNLPAPFADLARDVVIQVEDWIPDDFLDPGDDTQRQRDEITGLYDGIPLTEKSTQDMPHGPDIVWLFRHAIALELADRNVTLQDLVAHITIHEFAHHFGWSDDDIAAIDEWWV